MHTYTHTYAHTYIGIRVWWLYICSALLLSQNSFSRCMQFTVASCCWMQHNTLLTLQCHTQGIALRLYT